MFILAFSLFLYSKYFVFYFFQYKWIKIDVPQEIKIKPRKRRTRTIMGSGRKVAMRVRFSYINLPHQTSGTNYQLMSSLHVPYHLSKPTLKLIIFSTHLDWSRDRAPQIRLRRFGLCTLYK